MRTRLRVVVPSVVVAAALVVAGCGGGDEGTAAPSTSTPTPTPTATATAEDGGTGATTSRGGSGGATGGDTEDDGASDAPPFPANADPDTAEPSSDALATVTDIRMGRQDGFDRVVFEVDGEGTPGWDVRYVDEAFSQGSGDPVEVEGGAVLQITLTGMGLPHDTGVEEWTGPEPLTGDTEAVTELVFDATFEGTTVSFVGVTEQVPFRVYSLEGPTRVVVEVTDPA